MNKKLAMHKSYIWAVVAITALITGCKKETGSDSGGPQPVDTAAATSAKIKDTIIDYTRDIYLWYEQIPAGFDEQSYVDPEKIMVAIREYSRETGFDQPVDRWSFAIKQKEWDEISTGTGQDFGLNIFFRQEGDLRVKSVVKSSASGRAGVERGWRIVTINGNTNITTENADFIIDNLYSTSSTNVVFEKPDGTRQEVTLSASTYQENPIQLDTIYQVSGGKAGYIVFNSFLGDTSQIYADFQRIFNKFASEQVGDVIVDLRYNGGGYVSVQDKLANYLVKSSANGDIMMNQVFNDNYENLNETTRFSKLGSLNPARIFFIVSNNTASASELLINNLRPLMEVKLVGPSRTYGKPVGYFPIPVGDWYIFPVSFRSTNKSGQGNYFDGLPLDKQVPDGLDRNWGDTRESSLAAVLSYINTGSYGVPGQRAGAQAESTPAVNSGNRKFEERSFKGAIDTRGFVKP
jgi:carboxyl-terminal processing protease